MSVSDTESLISQLDPQRDYGRPFADVVADVRAGVLVASVGSSLPVLRDARSQKLVKGSGRRAGGHEAKVSRSYIERFFERNKVKIAQALLDGTLGTNGVKQDPRWADLLFKYGIGVPMDRGASGEDFAFALLKRLEQSRGEHRTERVTEIIEVRQQ